MILNLSFTMQGDSMPRAPDVHPTESRRGGEPADALVCTRCGDVVSFDAGGLEGLRDGLARSLGFELASHRLRLFGRCAPCQLADAAARQHGWGHA
jgi:Fe2+ or Zn2+ uptake regulation protein